MKFNKVLRWFYEQWSLRVPPFHPWAPWRRPAAQAAGGAMVCLLPPYPHCSRRPSKVWVGVLSLQRKVVKWHLPRSSLSPFRASCFGPDAQEAQRFCSQRQNGVDEVINTLAMSSREELAIGLSKRCHVSSLPVEALLHIGATDYHCISSLSLPSFELSLCPCSQLCARQFQPEVLGQLQPNRPQVGPRSLHYL